MTSQKCVRISEVSGVHLVHEYSKRKNLVSYLLCGVLSFGQLYHVQREGGGGGVGKLSTFQFVLVGTTSARNNQLASFSD